MVDVQTISIVIASTSVVAGVIYYALQLRHQIKQRQTDLLVRLFSSVNNKDWLEAWEKVRDREILDHGKYKEKYGFVELNEVFVFFEQLGRLIKKGLVDIDLLPFGPGQVKATWEKIKPVLEGGRKSYNEPKLGYGFEYLYNEMQKREQQLAKAK
jgi:hypothetical protein